MKQTKTNKNIGNTICVMPIAVSSIFMYTQVQKYSVLRGYKMISIKVNIVSFISRPYLQNSLNIELTNSGNFKG